MKINVCLTWISIVNPSFHPRYNEQRQSIGDGGGEGDGLRSWAKLQNTRPGSRGGHKRGLTPLILIIP